MVAIVSLKMEVNGVGIVRCERLSFVSGEEERDKESLI